MQLVARGGPGSIDCLDIEDDECRSSESTAATVNGSSTDDDGPVDRLGLLELVLNLACELAKGADHGDGLIAQVELGGYTCALTRKVHTELDQPFSVAGLSPREHEIARMVCNGLTNRAIASLLDISPWTVGTHLRRIFAKFEVGSRAAMVAHFLDSQHPEL